ncbi:hypothetical protein GA0061094_0660 [[Bacillus] enclensis]|uniref:Uncharacterized protein n=1 Tax=[Bacillus] enclensis TaxID=1402860 RepID=A0A1C3ZFG2_9BACI|nr:hypothetical protein GA0061094_0660 [[Bacillus] enclensis]
MMMFIRFIPILFFSITALTLFTFQGIEIFHAFYDFFSKK